MDLMGTAMVKGTLADGTKVLTVSVEAGTALEAWRALRAEHAMTGLWPFLVDAQTPTVLDTLPRPAEQREQHRSAAEIFAAADALAGDSDAACEAETVAPQADQASSVARTTTLGLVAAEYGGVEIPALLGWDGARGTSGVEHTAVLADWRRRFGAELLTLTADRLELHVPQPPTARDDVRALTREQAGYCGGVRLQSDGTLWSFTWDRDGV